jgi:hypothetical protein
VCVCSSCTGIGSCVSLLDLAEAQEEVLAGVVDQAAQITVKS